MRLRAAASPSAPNLGADAPPETEPRVSIAKDRHYVPIVKAKSAECDALQRFPMALRGALTPLFEVTPPEWDFDEERPKKSVAQHILHSIGMIARAWPTPNRCYLDAGLLDHASTLMSSDHPLALSFKVARTRGLNAVPVTGPARTPVYRQVARRLARRFGRGLCVRTGYSPAENVERWQHQLLTELTFYGLDAGEIDLVIDLRELAVKSDLALTTNAVVTLLTQLPHAARWRSLTLAGASFPRAVSRYVKRDSMGILPRREWDLWTGVRGSTVPRTPAFGDYVVQHPTLNETNPRFIRPSAMIRYTDDRAWHIVKGKQIAGNGNDQFYGLAAQLIREPMFRGAAFSSGDRYIAFVGSRRAPSPGNLTTWRAAVTSQHFAQVVHQLATWTAP